MIMGCCLPQRFITLVYPLPHTFQKRRPYYRDHFAANGNFFSSVCLLFLCTLSQCQKLVFSLYTPGFRYRMLQKNL